VQDHGAVVKDIVGAIEQGHGAASFDIEQWLPGAGVSVELLSVAPSKIVPPLDPMAEPLPQLSAGSDLLHPRIGIEGFLLHSSRPEALDQNSPAVSAGGRVIRALDPKHCVVLLGTTYAWARSCSSTCGRIPPAEK
jgi:hypothetical protein